MIYCFKKFPELPFSGQVMVFAVFLVLLFFSSFTCADVNEGEKGRCAKAKALYSFDYSYEASSVWGASASPTFAVPKVKTADAPDKTFPVALPVSNWQHRQYWPVAESSNYIEPILANAKIESLGKLSNAPPGYFMNVFPSSSKSNPDNHILALDQFYSFSGTYQRFLNSKNVNTMRRVCLVCKKASLCAKTINTTPAGMNLT